MNDFDAWILFDGPVPDDLRPVLYALRAPPEDHEIQVRALLSRLRPSLSLPPEDDADEAPFADTPAAPATPTDVARRHQLDALPPESAGAAPPPAARPPPAAPQPQAGPPGCPPAPEALKETSQSPEFEASLRAAYEAAMKGRRPPEVRVADAHEKPKTLQGRVVDTSTAPRTAQAPAAQPPHPLAATLPLGAQAPAAASPHPMAETLPLGAQAPALHAGPAPGAPERGADHVSRSLSRYVAYRVELELWPARSGDIHRKHEVESEAEYRELLQAWEVRFTQAPRLRAEADALRASCLAEARRMGWSRSGGG